MEDLVERTEVETVEPELVEVPTTEIKSDDNVHIINKGEAAGIVIGSMVAGIAIYEGVKKGAKKLKSIFAKKNSIKAEVVESKDSETDKTDESEVEKSEK